MSSIQQNHKLLLWMNMIVESLSKDHYSDCAYSNKVKAFVVAAVVVVVEMVDMHSNYMMMMIVVKLVRTN